MELFQIGIGLYISSWFHIQISSMSLFVLIQKVTKKIKEIRFPARCYPPNTDFQANARSPLQYFVLDRDLQNLRGIKLHL